MFDYRPRVKPNESLRSIPPPTYLIKESYGRVTIPSQAKEIRVLAKRVRRRLWWSQLIRKITGGGEGHWKRYQSS